jgi:DNA-binding IclR family transcriptional regulator
MSDDLSTKAAPTPRHHKPAKERHFVTALARGLEVLRCFQPEDPLLGNQDIARRVGLPKSTVSRLTGTLTSLGYLRWVPPTGKYELGASMRTFGSPELASANLRQLARPLMQALADHGRMSVSMGVQDRTSMLYVENCRSVAAVSLSVEVGARIPMATTAMGRAFVCSAPEEERESLLAQLQLEHGTDWPRLEAGLERSTQSFQRTGYCVSLGEWYEDVHAVAVPLMPVDGSQGVVFSIGGPAYQLGQPMIERDIGPRLVQLVRNLEAQLAIGAQR